MKAIEQFFPVVQFIVLYKVVLNFVSVNEILKCDHSNESCWGIRSCGAIYFLTCKYFFWSSKFLILIVRPVPSLLSLNNTAHVRTCRWFSWFRSLMISALSPVLPRLCEYNFCAASLCFGVSMRSVASTMRAHCDEKRRHFSASVMKIILAVQ